MSTTIKGIDVSEFNGAINWNETNVDFVLIRAGFGDNTIDSQFYNNVEGCIKHNIPFGIYWFSYAISEYKATIEADCVCDLAEKYGKIPIAFDFEEDSDNYAIRINHRLSNIERVNIALTFLNRVKDRGFEPILYTNYDYYAHKGFNDTRLRENFKYWYAQYGVDKPEPISANVCIWQYGQENINGVGNCDVNYMFENIFDRNMLNNMIENFKTEQMPYYLRKAFEVINGDYGNDKERVRKLRAKGYDAEIVQFIVNKILGLSEDICNYITKEQYPYYKTKAEAYKKGEYGTDKEAKKILNSKGYDFELIKHM